jgi:hypothetical protein
MIVIVIKRTLMYIFYVCLYIYVYFIYIVSYPMLRRTHPSRNFFVPSLFCVFMHAHKAKSAGL